MISGNTDTVLNVNHNDDMLSVSGDVAYILSELSDKVVEVSVSAIFSKVETVSMSIISDKTEDLSVWDVSGHAPNTRVLVVFGSVVSLSGASDSVEYVFKLAVLDCVEDLSARCFLGNVNNPLESVVSEIVGDVSLFGISAVLTSGVSSNVVGISKSAVSDKDDVSRSGVADTVDDVKSISGFPNAVADESRFGNRMEK